MAVNELETADDTPRTLSPCRLRFMIVAKTTSEERVRSASVDIATAVAMSIEPLRLATANILAFIAPAMLIEP